MKTLIFILILLAFLQTTIIPLNLVLIVLILRAYLVVEKENLLLAFGFGLLVSFLTNQALGPESIIYMVLVEAVSLIRKTPISGRILVVVPICLVLLSLHAIILAILMKSSIIIWPKVVIESILALPIYLVLRFWEERFIVRNDIKLKL